jgi:Ca2+-binding RTX toxin-like protein
MVAMATDGLDGGGGNDTLAGGSGNDSYVVNDSHTQIVEAAGGGIDSVQSSVTSNT